ncbi:putative Histidine kinase [Desulfamplus magnetovallimortis]|uniref:histidine kinase n=1 Tax=Desulfamplus magnetovallimortis TaxID=1246637 RepID=A0A1W1HCD6_9BACT|nr:ATP-binding protein [Desulfamplus magnetovallimortis]SLM30103.1 putative Histidine kinase [Desulfamplus magnetovallimortis]
MKLKSLRLKISAAIMVTCILISLSIAAAMYPFELERRQARLRNIHLLLHAVFDQKKDELANEIYADQKEALEISLEEIQRLENIETLFVYDHEGKMKASALSENFTIPDAIKSIDNIDTSSNFTRFSKKQYNQKNYAEFFSSIEVIGINVGYIRILYDLKTFQQESRMIFLFFAVLCLALLCIIILLNFFLTRSVILPASKLRNAMSALQEGDFGTQVTISSQDEIGQMAVAFNEMSQRLHRQHADLTSAIATKDAYALELKKSNRKLEQLNLNLENMVQERTIELSKSNKKLQEEIEERQMAYRKKEELEQRLARSKKMEALGLLAGGVAHDLNNVLSGVVSYPDLLLLDLEESDPMYKPVLTIKDSGIKAAAIVQDLLTLARRGVVIDELLNLNRVLKEYIMSPEHNKIQMYHNNIVIETNFQNDLLNIKGSPLHLKKSIMNLVSNAAEAQPDGGTIRISTYNRYVDMPIRGYEHVDEGDYVVLEVRDFGVGISEKDQERIFEPFYTKKTMGRSGTGLGMAVVWGTMQDHNGYINIKSKMNQGTTFELFFRQQGRYCPRRLKFRCSQVIWEITKL